MSHAASPPSFPLANATWEQLVIPAESGNQTVRDLFSDDLPADGYGREWAIFLFDGVGNRYVAPTLDDTLATGAGFWMIQLTGSEVQLDLPDLADAGTSGGPGCVSASGCTTVPLASSGRLDAYSMVGSALSTSTVVSDVRVRTTAGSSGCADGCSITQASGNGLMANYLYHYDSAANVYRNLVETGEMQPWQAAWVRTTTAAEGTAPELLFPTASPDNDNANCMAAPALPPLSVSDPGKTVVDINSESALQTALDALNDNTVLLLQPGTYNLTSTVWINHDNITIRGASNQCDAVVLVGRGMENASGSNDVPHGIWTASDNLKVQNLTIRDVYFHPISINGTGDGPQIYNVRMLDAGEQFVKVNPVSFGDGSDNGRVEYSIMEYTSGPPRTDHGGGTGYTNGVDVHAGKNWVIRNNRFKNFHTPDNAQNLWNPAILMWNGAGNTLVENNLFIDVDRAVAFGLVNRQNDHSGGIIRNNMIVTRPGLFSASRRADSDAQIVLWSSPGTQVLHNTLITRGNHARSIELRFNSQGSSVRNNLFDAPITHRNGDSFEQSGNVSTSDISLFRAPASGDLHLTRQQAGVTDAVGRLSNAPVDIDGDARPSGTSSTDAGADEYRP